MTTEASLDDDGWSSVGESLMRDMLSKVPSEEPAMAVLYVSGEYGGMVSNISDEEAVLVLKDILDTIEQRRIPSQCSGDG